MKISPLIPNELSLTDQLRPPDWTDLTIPFGFYLDQSFCYPVKVVHHHEIIGLGCAIIFEKTAWLAHIIVSENYRKQGIGGRIVEYLLNDIQSKGIQTISLLATDLGEPVYLRAGFHTTGEYLFLERKKNSATFPISGKIQSYQPDFYQPIVQLDTFVSGENRERLLKLFIKRSVVFIENHEIKGYYLPGLGDGPVCAKTPEAGFSLMAHKYADINQASLPTDNHSGLLFYKQLGFEHTGRIAKRMVWGEKYSWKPEMIYNRIGGNLG